MSGFNLVVPSKIIFGEGKIHTLNKYILEYGDNILFLCGKTSLKASGMYDKIIENFESDNISYEIHSIKEEPSVEIIDNLASEYRNKRVDAIVSIGGGSVIDTGKALSSMLKEDGSIKDFLEGVGTRTPSGKKVPFIAVPTTSGTGSEATKNAVIKGMDGEVRFKKSIRHDNLMPDVALVDPVLTLNCPKNVTMQSGIDAFCQLLEAYICTNSNTFTDMLAEKGLKRMCESLLSAYNNGEDLDARNDVAYASLLSGICMANAELTTIHGFAGVIGGFYDNIPHGAICASLLHGATVVNIQKIKDFEPNNPAAYKYAKIGAFLMDANYSPDRHEVFFRAVVDTLKSWNEEMNIPRLSDFSIEEDDFWKILEEAKQRYNPVKLSNSEMEKILEYSY
ncbi:iron-containing alcohol dehydrogenase [Anaerofustis stercorihominis]|nr:iron-containing alcohol dehydrogenase [Anaerofustis stercorihominis]